MTKTTAGDTKKLYMSDPEKVMEYLENQIPHLAASAARLAYWQALVAGQSVLISDDGAIYDGLARWLAALRQTN